MAKLRLLQHHKSTLLNNAMEHILPKQLKQAYDLAYERAAPLVTAAVNAKFKPAEMAVLQKYNCTTRYNTARVLFPNGAVQQFDWRGTPNKTSDQDEVFPLVPNSNEFRWNTMYPLDVKAAAAVEAWVKARDAYTVEYEKRKRAYHALIVGAHFLEDLLGVWPEAAAIIPKTGGAIIALGPEQIETIKRDLEEQRKEQ